MLTVPSSATPLVQPEHGHYVLRVLAALTPDPSRPVLQDASGPTTGGQLHAAVTGAAHSMAQRGVGPGRAVAVLTVPNGVATLVARYAAHLLGAPVVHVRSSNPRADGGQLPVEHQQQLLRAAGAVLLVVDAEHLERGRALVAEAPAELVLAALTPLGDDVALLRPGSPQHALAADLVLQDVAVIGTTSGSTGAPRATCHSFAAWDATVRSFPGAGEDGRAGVLLVVTPVNHTVAPMVDAVLAAGGRVVLHDRFEALRVWRTIREQEVTDLYLAVPHLHQLLDAQPSAAPEAHSLRRLVYSGSPAAPHRISQAWERIGPSIVQLYGTTEAGGISCLTPLDHAEPELRGTVGRPFAWVGVQLRDPQSGAPVARGGTGEVWVRTPTAMSCYLDDPELTAAVLRDGWLCTGDLGRWDPYGYLQLRGRTGDVIKSGGLKIHPAAVELALLEHPDVLAAAAFGAPGPDDVESVHAAVVLRAGTGSPEAVRSHVAGRLDEAHVPAQLMVLDDLPLLPSGKPDRARLRVALAATRTTPCVPGTHGEPRSVSTAASSGAGTTADTVDGVRRRA